MHESSRGVQVHTQAPVPHSLGAVPDGQGSLRAGKLPGLMLAIREGADIRSRCCGVHFHVRPVTDMDVYSTALWFLHKDTELSALSEDLADSWYLSPQALCAKGNYLSMHKEHEDAIKFFRRATQVAPRFVYAYTLLGHEYMYSKDLSNAKKCFRTAATINSRHYNAFFGLGKVSLREEEYRAAEYYFKMAFSINSSSCFICSRLGKVKHSLNR